MDLRKIRRQQFVNLVKAENFKRQDGLGSNYFVYYKFNAN